MRKNVRQDLMLRLLIFQNILEHRRIKEKRLRLKSQLEGLADLAKDRIGRF